MSTTLPGVYESRIIGADLLYAGKLMIVSPMVHLPRAARLSKTRRDPTKPAVAWHGNATPWWRTEFLSTTGLRIGQRIYLDAVRTGRRVYPYFEAVGDE